jgi:putative ABC transport system permease protein
MMLTNYIKITLRNLYKEKLYALINVSGLSLSMACCIILGLFLRSELTYDRHHMKHERIFRIAAEVTNHGKVYRVASTSAALGPMLSKDYPEIEAYVRFNFLMSGRALEFRYEEKAFDWDDVYFADDNVFDIFTHEYVYGEPEGALSDPRSIAVSESFAKKYFGDTNPIGKTVRSAVDFFKITLVFADLPENSHLNYDVLISYNSLENPGHYDAARGDLWTIPDFTYLLMPEGYQATSFEEIAESFYKRYMKEEGEAKNTSMKFWLQPLADIHLESGLLYDSPTGNKLHLYAFLAVGIFIILVGCLNYINLSTARSARKGREVGMRKVLGATRPQLIVQFLGESVLFTLIAWVIGIIMVKLAFTYTPVNDLLGKQQLTSFSDQPVLLFWMLGLSLVTGMIAGSYPAVYLSSILPITALTGRSQSGKRIFRVRELLVMVQFIISIGVIASTLLMGMQLQYIANKPLGFDKENRLIIRLRGADRIENFAILRNELLRNDRVLTVSMTADKPGGVIIVSFRKIENNEGVTESQTVSGMRVGENFLNVMGIELSLGRDFSKKLLTDVAGVALVNEAMVKKMGWVEPLGKRVNDCRIIGVVRDFHFTSLHQQIEPLVITRIKDDFSEIDPVWRSIMSMTVLVHISGEHIFETLKYIEEVFLEFDPLHPLEYEFLDDSLDQLYFQEWRLMLLTGVFSAVCIFISCLGLFTLVAFTTAQRIKEIAIRKVLGATTLQIIAMIARRILFLVLVASGVASLAAYLAIDEWLAGFAYRTHIKPLVFVLSAVVAMVVAFVTVALKSFKAAQANPVHALRSE